MDKRIAQRAIKAGGGPSKVARRLTELSGKPISTQAVSLWQQSRIPIEWVKHMETISGKPRHKLRPDVYDAPTTAPAVEVRA